ncbi:STAS domain-containing protein [Streptomyces sp. NPDC059382]|uniref:STAS domain-containing protein n=1 Tax=Streptomyces sp. NPDC059382 TaxID=3346816 RepID=UPI0036C43AD3
MRLITFRTADTGPVLEITGDLDYDSAPRLRKAVDGLTLARGQKLVPDLAGLDFCGITVLLAARNLAIEQQGDIVLASVPDNPARVLRIIGLDRVFTIHPNASAAPPAHTASPTTAAQ